MKINKGAFLKILLNEGIFQISCLKSSTNWIYFPSKTGFVFFSNNGDRSQWKCISKTARNFKSEFDESFERFSFESSYASEINSKVYITWVPEDA